MDEFYKKEDFLARWANGTLSEEEKKKFRETADYIYYEAILEGTDILEVPPYDSEKLFEKVQSKKRGVENKTKVFRLPRWSYAVAAGLALIFGYMFLFDQTIDYTTGYGEQLALVLPDESEVILNAKSKLGYKKKNWEKERIVNLEGEAYFKVNKGGTFTVATSDGSVTVLGTEFTVNSDENVFEVICYEGKVKVRLGVLEKVITAGEAVRFVRAEMEEWTFTSEGPSWTQGESSFNNAPLSQVVKALEEQFNITINTEDITKKIRFTGSFTHDNLQKALRTVFEPLEIKFTFISKNTIDLAEK